MSRYSYYLNRCSVLHDSKRWWNSEARQLVAVSFPLKSGMMFHFASHSSKERTWRSLTVHFTTLWTSQFSPDAFSRYLLSPVLYSGVLAVAIANSQAPCELTQRRLCAFAGGNSLWISPPHSLRNSLSAEHITPVIHVQFKCTACNHTYSTYHLCKVRPRSVFISETVSAHVSRRTSPVSYGNRV